MTDTAEALRDLAASFRATAAKLTATAGDAATHEHAGYWAARMEAGAHAWLSAASEAEAAAAKLDGKA